MAQGQLAPLLFFSRTPAISCAALCRTLVVTFVIAFAAASRRRTSRGNGKGHKGRQKRSKSSAPELDLSHSSNDAAAAAAAALSLSSPFLLVNCSLFLVVAEKSGASPLCTQPHLSFSRCARTRSTAGVNGQVARETASFFSASPEAASTHAAKARSS